MNDTNSQVLGVFQRGESLSSSGVHQKIAKTVSLVTVKRSLSELEKSGLLKRTGAGRSVVYELTRCGVALRPIAAEEYLTKTQEKRITNKNYNNDLFSGQYIDLLTADQTSELEQATKNFQAKAKDNQAVHDRELQRFIIEMSWKSAEMEGNTYSLLDTEKLLTYGIASSKNTEFETQMILNQKAAFDFVLQTKDEWKLLKITYIEKLHEHIVEGLGVERNLRSSVVGITGTDYTPLGNQHQIKEALEQLLEYSQKAPNAYEQALQLTVGMSYIQPFNDGNKRTARMTANAVLLANQLAPISYRSVDDTDYKSALLVYYEQNSIVAFRELFVNQYIYSAENYNVAKDKEEK